MKSLPKMSRTRRRLLAGSVLASAAVLAFAGPVLAQEAAADTDTTEVVVVGARKNLQSAQQIKRNADTVVDSITSEDIGSFPDKSVAEALQRVAGITVTRFNGSDDTSHFSAEPSGVIVRGLNQVRSEFNGRDTFSANSDRGLSWGDISPELMSRIDVYKNQSADLIEGGIAGTVDLRTRLPFDVKGQTAALSLDYSYGDIAKEWAPAVSGIYTNRWQTELGEFGVMANLAYSKVMTASQGVQYDRMGIFDPAVFGTEGLAYIPSGIYLRDNLYDRRRQGIALAAQWRSNDGSMLLTGQFNRSGYDNSWQEHSIYSSGYSIYGEPTDYIITGAGVVAPATGTPDFTFDSNGNFLTGQWSNSYLYLGETPDSDKAVAVNAAGDAFFQKCYSWEGCVGRKASQIDSAVNRFKNKQYTQDASLNFKWDPTDRIRLNFDVQYVESEIKNYNASVTTRTFADTFIDATGEYPTLQIAPDSAELVNLSPGGILNANNYSYYAVTDHTEDSEGTELAARADLQYSFGSTWLDSLKVGVRYAERDQTVRWGAYNWANIANTWAANAAYYNIDSAAYPEGHYETFDFGGDFFDGGQMDQSKFVFFKMDSLMNRDSMAEALGNPSLGFGEYMPVCSNTGYRAGEVYTGDFGCYKPNEILKVNEETQAAYLMMKFGGPDARIFGSIGVSGNIGIRYVHTEDMTQGSFTNSIPFDDSLFVDLDPTTPVVERGAPICDPGPDVGGRATVSQGCIITPDEIAFNDGSFFLSTANAKHDNWLPSFNVKFDLTDKWVLRFAASKAMARPDIGLLKNYTVVTRIAPAVIYADEVANTTYTYRIQAGNPYLKPMTADQFDLALEHYFASVGSMTVTVFKKKFYDYVQSGTLVREVVNNGVERDVLVKMPMNGDGAEIEGVEFAYQRFFDFLPAPFDGLGMQANYTYVSNKGITTSQLISESADGSTGTAGGGVSYDETAVKPDALEGISPRSYNLIAMYEKNKLSMRLAYSWRSKFLVTAVDCCVGLPVWQDDAGFLDGSVRYRLTDKVELSLEGSNLLGTDTVLFQQVDNNGTLKPNAWFKNDRRAQVGLRLKF